jgi:outer membrane protein assembly factor BamB
MLSRFVSSSVLLGLAAVGLAADAPRPGAFDWPQWQGPERQAYCKETGLLKSWPKDGPLLVWQAKDLGGGYSTPSVAAGHIFGMGARNKDEYVWALDEATGRELWSVRINAQPPQVGYGEGPRCTPTVDGDRLYAVGVGGDLVCLRVEDGKEVWRRNYGKDFQGRMMSGWGYSESPLVDGDKLICTPGADAAALVALDKNTGEVLWKAAVPRTGGAGYASIVVADVAGIRQYIQLLGQSGGLVGISARDGKLLWRYNRMANGTANIPTPIVHDNYVFCATGYNKGSALLKLEPDGAGGIKAQEVYFLSGSEFQNTHGGMVLVGDYIYGGHGHNQGEPTCLEFKTGKVVWRGKPAGGGSAAVLYADGCLYFRYQDGVMALVEATAARYHQLSTFKLPAVGKGKPSWPHPIIANGKLYIRDQDGMLCYDVKQHSS